MLVFLYYYNLLYLIRKLFSYLYHLLIVFLIILHDILIILVQNVPLHFKFVTNGNPYRLLRPTKLHKFIQLILIDILTYFFEKPKFYNGFMNFCKFMNWYGLVQLYVIFSPFIIIYWVIKELWAFSRTATLKDWGDLIFLVCVLLCFFILFTFTIYSFIVVCYR